MNELQYVEFESNNKATTCAYKNKETTGVYDIKGYE